MTGAGISQDKLVEELSRRLAERVGIAEGPTGPYTTGPAWGAQRITFGDHGPALAALLNAPKPPKKPPALVPKEERSDRSEKKEIKVRYPDSNAEAIESLASEIAGKRVGPKEIAELAGAPVGSTVVASSYKESSVNFLVNSRAYNFSGQLVRNPDESLVLKLDKVHVAKSRRRQGIGSAAFGRQLEQARKLGVERIELDGARNDDPRSLQVGYKVWPKFGFDADLNPRRVAGLPDSLRGVTKLSDLRATAEGREWWDKNGWSTPLTFDMKPGSRSWQIWRAYADRNRP